jgi:hypothetical protein
MVIRAMTRQAARETLIERNRVQASGKAMSPTARSEGQLAGVSASGRSERGRASCPAGLERFIASNTWIATVSIDGPTAIVAEKPSAWLARGKINEN